MCDASQSVLKAIKKRETIAPLFKNYLGYCYSSNERR